MDGIAIRHGALMGNPPHEFTLVGECRAGHPFTPGVPQHDDCVRIFTGAPIPSGFDTVVIQEDCEFHGSSSEPRVRSLIHPDLGANVRQVGHDIQADNKVVSAGERLTPFSVGWLAACGITRVKVTKRPRVGIFSTGDELGEPGSELRPGQIFDANRVLLTRLLDSLPVQADDLGILPDEPQAIRSALKRHGTQYEMLITSAGVSVGDADFVTSIIQEIGTLQLWRLLIKPGKPLAYGTIGTSKFFGLPGNPVSTIVTFLCVVRPALLKLCGASAQEMLEHRATLADPIRHKPGREEFQRGRLARSKASVDGELMVHVTGDQSSNRLASFQSANCLIRIPKASSDLEPGTRVTVLPFKGLL